MLMVQDLGFTLKSTVTDAMWFSAHVVLNRTELLCHVRSTHVRSTFCHMRVVLPQNTVYMRHDVPNLFLFIRHYLLNVFHIFSNSRNLTLGQQH